MKIYLDTKRTPKDSKAFTIVRNITDFINLTKKEKIFLLSLDHDLSESKLALNVITYLINNNIFIQYINLHNFSRTGNLLIKKRLEKKFPEIVVTMNCHI